jgi:hypothetical protein
MITFRITTDIKDDRRVVLTLPAEVPTGKSELIVSVEQPGQGQTSLADWVEERAQSNGDKQARYPLRGSVVRYEGPTEPVAGADWEALR